MLVNPVHDSELKVHVGVGRYSSASRCDCLAWRKNSRYHESVKPNRHDVRLALWSGQRNILRDSQSREWWDAEAIMNERSQIRGAKGAISRSRIADLNIKAEAGIQPNTTPAETSPAKPRIRPSRVIAFGDGTVVRYQSASSGDEVKVEWKRRSGAPRISKRTTPYIVGASQRDFSGKEKR
jgi:hypothetical protein